MSDSDYHKPWGALSPEVSRPSMPDWGSRLPGIIRAGMAFIVRHLRRFGGWWSTRVRLLWQRPGASARLAAIGLFLAGLAALVILGYLLLYLIPLLILAALIAAICSTLAAKE